MVSEHIFETTSSIISYKEIGIRFRHKIVHQEIEINKSIIIFISFQLQTMYNNHSY